LLIFIAKAILIAILSQCEALNYCKLSGNRLMLIFRFNAISGKLGEGCTGFRWGKLRERDQWGDPDADGRIILRWIFRKWEGLWGLDGVGSG